MAALGMQGSHNLGSSDFETSLDPLSEFTRGERWLTTFSSVAEPSAVALPRPYQSSRIFGTSAPFFSHTAMMKQLYILCLSDVAYAALEKTYFN